MIASGLRIFDIRDPEHPREIAYFNMPRRPGGSLVTPEEGSYAMSAPAWDPRHGQVWYTDVHSGFYSVRLTNGVQRLLRR